MENGAFCSSKKQTCAAGLSPSCEQTLSWVSLAFSLCRALCPSGAIEAGLRPGQWVTLEVSPRKLWLTILGQVCTQTDEE